MYYFYIRTRTHNPYPVNQKYRAINKHHNFRFILSATIVAYCFFPQRPANHQTGLPLGGPGGPRPPLPFGWGGGLEGDCLTGGSSGIFRDRAEKSEPTEPGDPPPEGATESTGEVEATSAPCDRNKWMNRRTRSED